MSEDKFIPDNSEDDSTKSSIDTYQSEINDNGEDSVSPEESVPAEKKTLEEVPENVSSENKASEETSESVSSENSEDQTSEELQKNVPSENKASEGTSENISSENKASEEIPENVSSDNIKKKPKFNVYKAVRIACMIGFVVFTALFINEVVIQPYRIQKSIDLTRELYNKPTEGPTAAASPTKIPEDITAAPTPQPVEATPTPDPNRDSLGRLLQFQDLLAANADVKGWLTIPDTNIDYVVMQSGSNNPEYYLDKDINLKYSKAGTLFLDYHGSVEKNSQNIVIHGHNMVSTVEKMFHYLLQYKKVNYYKEHPLITFDTIYDTGKWKIFAVFITNGTSKKEPLFDYTRANFTDSSDFLNFVYQLRIRSVLNIDSVDVNENDRLLMLSTCSYEVDNYRTVIVARKVRDGEDPSVNTEDATVNENPLYPASYYYRYGGKAPKLADTFKDALANDDITWYIPPTDHSAE